METSRPGSLPFSRSNAEHPAKGVAFQGVGPGAVPPHTLEQASPEVRSLRMPRGSAFGADAYAAATVGGSEPMLRLRSQVKRIAPYFRTALLMGIPGTGKEGVARMLHALSPCSDGEFIACEASAFAEAMLRDEGRAVLDALVSNPAGGTLFLEDIGDVAPALQGAVLRIWTVQGRGKIRVVAGTHRDLRTMGVTGQFRQDLAQRLMGVELTMTPLRERPGDLPEVIGEVLRRVSGERQCTLSGDALARLVNHAWPGDLAELETCLWAAARAAEGRGTIEPGDLPAFSVERAAEPEDTLRSDKLQDVVQQHVLGVLTRCAGNKLRAAEVLGISRSTLYRMLESCVGGSFTSF